MLIGVFRYLFFTNMLPPHSRNNHNFFADGLPPQYRDAHTFFFFFANKLLLHDHRAQKYLLFCWHCAITTVAKLIMFIYSLAQVRLDGAERSGAEYNQDKPVPNSIFSIS